MALTVIASLTDVGRNRLAQQLISGKSFLVNQFSVNSAGHDPSSPTIALTPDTTATVCPGGAPLFTDDIASSTLLNAFCPQFECVIPLGAGIGSISNLCLFGHVVYSPIPNDPDIGSSFLFAIGNFPLKVKTAADTLTMVVSIQF